MTTGQNALSCAEVYSERRNGEAVRCARCKIARAMKAKKKRERSIAFNQDHKSSRYYWRD
eukprot:scaffold3226_cov160-Amphora_coffeaeformis.AAC.27